ncbi:MAG TPA: outer membrane lipoprotein carrier protein LolA, partial [Burkholderiaceae bacterium]
MHSERRRVCIALAACAATGGFAAPARAAFGFDELMGTLAQRRSGEARFVEQRFVSVLDQTLTYTGTLSFTAPDRLARHTLTPRPESFVVE